MSREAVLASIFINIFRDEPLFAMPYRVLESLVEFEEQLTFWRTRHATMVHRMLGKKIGTGGSSGYAYLKATIENHKIFADLFDSATFLVPRSVLPSLPRTVAQRLQQGLNNASNDADTKPQRTAPAQPRTQPSMPVARHEAVTSGRCPYSKAYGTRGPSSFSSTQLLAAVALSAAATFVALRGFSSPN